MKFYPVSISRPGNGIQNLGGSAKQISAYLSKFSGKTEQEEVIQVKTDIQNNRRINEWLSKEAFNSEKTSLPKTTNKDVLAEILNKFTVAVTGENMISWQSLFPLTGELLSKPQREARLSAMKFLHKERLVQFHPMGGSSYWTMDRIIFKAFKEIVATK